MTLYLLNKLVNLAKCPEDVFDKDLKTTYRELAKLCHPDVSKDPLARETFDLLQEWKAKADLKGDAYGNRSFNPKPYVPFSFNHGSDHFTSVELLSEDYVSRVHKVEDKYNFLTHFIRIPKHPQNNDLLEREFKHLKIIFEKDSNPEFDKFFNIRWKFIPKPLANITFKDTKGATRKSNLCCLQFSEGYSLEDLVKNHFKGGLPKEHAYWIFRRTLLNLYMAHYKGIVHGAVTPNNIIVLPKQHEVILTNWVASAKLGKEHIPILDKSREQYYPPSVVKKEKASISTDIYMLTKTILGCSSLSDRMSKEMLSYLSTKKNTVEIYDDFEKMIEKIDGPRKFVPMEI